MGGSDWSLSPPGYSRASGTPRDPRPLGGGECSGRESWPSPRAPHPAGRRGGRPVWMAPLWPPGPAPAVWGSMPLSGKWAQLCFVLIVGGPATGRRGWGAVRRSQAGDDPLAPPRGRGSAWSPAGADGDCRLPNHCKLGTTTRVFEGSSQPGTPEFGELV